MVKFANLLRISLHILNTLTTNLIIRTREFGTLRAVGMTSDQLRRLARLEGLFYGVFSAAWGGLVGSGLAYLMLKMVAEIQRTEGMPFPWLALGLAMFGAIGVSVLATLLPARRLSNLTVIEALRMVD